MNIFHIYSDWKWTGPSEPILNLCVGLRQIGHNVSLACLEPPDESLTHSFPFRIREKGINPVLLRPSGKLSFLFALLDNINRIEEFIKQSPIDVIHAHSSLDHFIAAKAVRHLEKKPKIIRTNHKGYQFLPSLITNWLIKYKTDGYITLSKSLLEVDRKSFPDITEKSWVLGGIVDTEKFNIEKIHDDIRARLKVGKEDIIVAVVARIQRHRRFEIILAVLENLVKEFPNLKLLVIGRGTLQDEILTKPAEQKGLKDNIIHIMQRVHDRDYVEYLSVINFGIFLVPGSDGSCRAVLEMMSLSKPVIVSKIGILPEIIDNEVNGLVIDDTSDNLAEAIKNLVTNQDNRIKYGLSARTKAISDFSIESVAKKAEEIYLSVLK
jgi:glycosyltransferase involved in cell wall biosynthesis